MEGAGLRMATGWVGAPLRRREDLRLLTGRGRFIDDLAPVPRCHHAALLRSPHAHARILRVDTSAARAQPGVVAVLTGADIVPLLRPFAVGVPSPPPYYPIAVDRVRYVGEPVAVVVATSRYAAEDALEAVEVDYEPLPAVVDAEAATAPGAPRVHDTLPSNVVLHRTFTYGDVEGAFRSADLVVEGTYRFPRYASTPIETYGVIAHHDPAEGTYTVWCNFHGPFSMHPLMARALGVPEHRLRLIVPEDIGGSFGIKTMLYPYIVLLAAAARLAQGPVRWIEDRREHLLASSSGADRRMRLQAAVTKDGEVRALRLEATDNVGAYIRAPEPGCLFRTHGNVTGPYRIPAVALDLRAVLTHTAPTGLNRGYGNQQLYFGVERLMDAVAEALGMDPAEVRLRNLISPEAFPYRTPTGGVYDSGDYPRAFRRLLEKAAYGDLRRAQDEARRAGRLLGIGLAVAVDPSVSNMGYVDLAYPAEERRQRAKSGGAEAATLSMDPTGTVTLLLNTAPEGQGHETVAAQIVASELGIDPDQVRVDARMDTLTHAWTIASGSYSSRFAGAGASAVAEAARRLRDKLVRIASCLLEAAPEDIEVAGGACQVRGAPQRSVPFRRLAGVAHWDPDRLPPGMDPGLHVTAFYTLPTLGAVSDADQVNSSGTYGFCAELAVVEVDPETWEVRCHRYVAVHDAGRILNPLLAEGQVHGAAAHGLGGALYEELVYDSAGQLLTASFMDYPCPTAAEVPRIEVEHLETPSPITVLGSKGLGESSAMTAPVLLANAVADALRPLGVRIRELPLTPARLAAWVREAAAGGLGREAP